MGTSHIEWGQAPPGSVTSSLQFNDYDAFPGQDQEWYWGGGQTVNPGQSFRAGSITYRNGSAAAGTSSPDLTVDLDTYVFGSEFYINEHPLVVLDTLKIRIRETPNTGVDPAADADFLYFPDFPSLGSIRVYEGASTTFPIYATFGPVIPTAFGAPQNPHSGFLSSSIVDSLTDNGAPVFLQDYEAPGNLDEPFNLVAPYSGTTDGVNKVQSTIAHVSGDGANGTAKLDRTLHSVRPNYKPWRWRLGMAGPPFAQ